MSNNESDSDDGKKTPPGIEQNEDDGLPKFGQAIVQHHLFDLKNQSDRGRGGLTERDRLFLLKHDLEGQSARRVRMQIRDRLLNTYFDLRHLPYVSDNDRDLIFVKAADDYDLHLKNSLKEFVKFTHRGLAGSEVDDIAILEQAIQEAEEEEAIANGELFDGDVDFSLDSARVEDISEIRAKYERRKELDRDELAALINDETTAIDLAEALYYQARQLWGGAEPKWPGTPDLNYSQRDPDAHRAEEILEELRELFDELDIKNYREFDIEWDRLVQPGGPADHRLHELVRELDDVAPYFDRQMAAEAGLSESDMDLLHRLLWDPNNSPVEDVIEEEAKPKMAGDDWSPSESDILHKFIARVQVARETHSFFTSGGAEGKERWSRVLGLAEFNENEWSAYIQEQRIRRCKDAIHTLLQSTDELSHRNLGELLKESKEVPETELADYDDIQEERDLSQSEVENMKRYEALWTLLPEDADKEDLRDVANTLGRGIVLEAFQELAEEDEE